MKAGWEIRSLGEVCEIYNGGTPSTNIPEYWDGGIQWITPKDMGKSKDMYVSHCERTISQEGVEHSSTKVLPERSVIVSSRAPIGYVAINEVPMATNQGCKGFVLGKEIYPEFLYYFLLSSTDLLNKLGTGATFKEVSGKKLAGIELPFPSLPEQQRIVDILDQEFAKIDALKANAEKSLQAAKDLFQATLKKELEPKDGWKHNAMAEIADMCLGKMLDRSKNTGVMQPYLRNVNVRWDGFDLEDLLSMPFEEREQERYGIKDGDIIMCEGGEPARCAIWAGQIPGMKIQKALHRIRMHNGLFNRFVMYSFLHYNNTGLLNSYISGATIKHLTGEKLKQVILYYPDYLTQIAIATSLDEQNSRCKSIQENYQKTLTLCDDLKQSLLRKAFNGEL